MASKYDTNARLDNYPVAGAEIVVWQDGVKEAQQPARSVGIAPDEPPDSSNDDSDGDSDDDGGDGGPGGPSTRWFYNLSSAQRTNYSAMKRTVIKMMSVVHLFQVK